MNNTHITNMILISITIVGLGCEFQNPCIFLILYLLVIPFQILINNKQYMMIRCGVYLGMYVEPKIEGMRWEKTVHRVDNVFKEKHKVKILLFSAKERYHVATDGLYFRRDRCDSMHSLCILFM